MFWKNSNLNKKILPYRKLLNVAIVNVFTMPLLLSCSAPRVSPLVTVNNYNESPTVKVLKVQQEGSVVYYQDGTIALSNVPFFQQGNDNTCGQAVMAIILNYWGIDLPYQKIVNQTNSSNTPTDIDKITNYLRKNGLYAQDYRQTTLNFLKNRIQQGKPVIALLDFGSLAKEHYVVVTGYNEDQQQIIMHDPVDGPNVKLTYTDFQNKWENRSLKNFGLFGDKYTRIVFDVDDNH